MLSTLPWTMAVDLKIDINQRSAANNIPANTESGFQPFAITTPASGVVTGSTANTATFGAQTVTITGTGTANSCDDRKRTVPANSGAFTQAALLQDFIFATYVAATNPNAGLDISITGLSPNTAYAVSLWSYDNSSGGSRVSDWSANGILAVDNYTFDGRVLPSTNEQYQVNFNATADATGKILIQGRRDSASVDTANLATHGVFLNALWIRDLFVDADNDGMDDAWESAHGLNVGLNDAALDPDSDFSTNFGEYQAGTDPRDGDSDNDALPDGYENRTGTWINATNTGTNPLIPDTDGDGLGDSLENPDLPWLSPAQPGTNPNLADTDGDTFTDGEEVNWPAHPRDIAVYPFSSGTTLAVDLENLTASPQPAFQSIPGTDTTGVASAAGNFGPYTVTINAAGSTTLQARDRGTGAAAGGFTPMFRDFIFAQTSDNDDDGLDVIVTGLAPLTNYPVTLWSWDPTSAGTARRSTWLANDGDSGPVVKVPLYSMVNATPVPSSGKERRLRFDAVSDSNGTLTIQGRKETGYAGATINVFLNGFVIGPPVTPMRFTAIAAPQFTFASDDFATYEILASPDLLSWTSIAPAVDGQPGTTTFTDPAAGLSRRFYRVDRTSP